MVPICTTQQDAGTLHELIWQVCWLEFLVVMKGGARNRVARLVFDDFVNMVLEDVVFYETTAQGIKATKLDQILLNGNNICMASLVLRKKAYPLSPSY